VIGNLSEEVFVLRVEISKTVFTLQGVHWVEVHVAITVEVINKFELLEVSENKVTDCTSLRLREGVRPSVYVRADFVEVSLLTMSHLLSTESESVVTVQVHSDLVMVFANVHPAVSWVLILTLHALSSHVSGDILHGTPSVNIDSWDDVQSLRLEHVDGLLIAVLQLV